MEEGNLYSAYNSALRDDDTGNSITMRTPMPIFACPTRRSPAADRNFDDNDAKPLAAAQHCGALGDYAANAGYLYTTGMANSKDTTGAVYIQFGTYNPVEAGPIFSASRIAIRNVTDGLSKTLAIGERYIPPVPTGTEAGMEDYAQGDTAFISGDQPRTIFAGTKDGLATGSTDANLSKFGSLHPGIVQFVFLDGHVSSIDDAIAPKDLMALSTIAGGEAVLQN